MRNPARLLMPGFDDNNGFPDNPDGPESGTGDSNIAD